MRDHKRRRAISFRLRAEERRHRPTDTDTESDIRSRMNTNGEGSVDRNAGTTEVDERIVFELLRKYAYETDVSVPLLMLLRRQRERRSMQDANAIVSVAHLAMTDVRPCRPDISRPMPSSSSGRKSVLSRAKDVEPKTLM